MTLGSEKTRGPQTTGPSPDGRPSQETAPGSRPLDFGVGPWNKAQWVVVAGLVLFGVVVVTLGMSWRVQGEDIEFTRAMIERADTYGGTYYENAIFNKGPLGALFYDLALRVTTDAGFWYAIAALVAAAGLILSYAAARSVRFGGGNRAVAASVGAAVFVYFAIAAGGLYVRNITTALLAITWVLIIDERAWATPTRRTATAAVTGALVGFAVQTLLTTIFASAVLLGISLILLRRRVDSSEWMRLTGITIMAGTTAFMTAIVWYAMRGALTEFWAGWWTYARFFHEAPGQSLATQFGAGWDWFYAYYQARPLAFAVVAVFVVVTVGNWRGSCWPHRVVRVGLLGWWMAAWLELTLSQRYYDHYFAVVAVPTALMAAVLAGHTWQLVGPKDRLPRSSVVWPLLAAVIAVYLMGPVSFVQAWNGMTGFRGPAANAAFIERYMYDGNTRAVGAVLDLVSEDGDPLLAWTPNSWPYMKWHRVSATRFIWWQFLVGEIWPGGPNPALVLPSTWEWFSDDLQESRPVAFAEVTPLIEGTPFSDYLNANFDVVYPGSPVPVALRRDVATALLESHATDPWVAPRQPGADRSGWVVDTGRALFEDVGSDWQSNRLFLARGPCVRVEGTIDTGEGTRPWVDFVFEDTSGKVGARQITIVDDHVVASDDWLAFEDIPTELAEPGPVDFSLVVGERSAGLVVNGKLRGAVGVPFSASIEIVPQTPFLILENLRVAPGSAEIGC